MEDSAGTKWDQATALSPLKERQTRTCRFPTTLSAGKPAPAALPPFEAAVKLHLQVFLLCEWRKTCTRSFSVVSSCGKAAPAGFPPLRVEEILHLQLFRRFERR
ncbi:hypothetical protein AAC387_Pa07g3499 [Persea americana]